MMTRKLQRVETPGDYFGVSNTTETLEQTKTKKWRPTGQETDSIQPQPTR